MPSFRHTVREIQAQKALRESNVKEAVFLGGGAAIHQSPGSVHLLTRLTTGPGWRVTLFYPETDPDGKYPLGTLIPQQHAEYGSLEEVAAEHFHEWEPYRTRRNPSGEPDMLLSYELSGGEWKWAGSWIETDPAKADRYGAALQRIFSRLEDAGLKNPVSFRFLDFRTTLIIGLPNIDKVLFIDTFEMRDDDNLGGHSIFIFATPAAWEPSRQVKEIDNYRNARWRKKGTRKK